MNLVQLDMEEEDKLIAKLLNIPLDEYDTKTVLYSSNKGSECVFNNKKHSIIGDIFYIVEINAAVNIKNIVFVESILNMILFIKSKKIDITPNLVVIVCNNPSNEIINTILNTYPYILSYTFGFGKSVNSKIQILKLLLYLSGEKVVKVNVDDNNIRIEMRKSAKSISSNILIHHLIRDFQIKNIECKYISLGYNIYNINQLYEYNK